MSKGTLGALPVSGFHFPWIVTQYFLPMNVHPPIVFADLAEDLTLEERRILLGGKGASLAEMSGLMGLPVPPAFTITTEVCRRFLAGGWPDDLDDLLHASVRGLEERSGRRFGDPSDPLLVSVRSGAPVSMPGMMDTVLNLGLNDETAAGLAASTDDRFALDTHRRFIQSYASVVLGVGTDLRVVVGKALDRAGVDREAALAPDDLRALLADLRTAITAEGSSPVPDDPYEQLRGAVKAVFGSWRGDRAVVYRKREGIPEELGTACTVQAMVFGNRDERSGTGVAFTRDPTTGEDHRTGDFLLNAQGEDVVAGTHATMPLDELATHLPEVAEELERALDVLERHERDLCDVEFTIEEGRLHILQARRGKRTGAAALRIAVDLVADPEIALTRAEALVRVTPDHLEQVLHARFADSAGAIELASGLAASPGAAVGGVCLTAEAALDASERGEPVILVRQETSPDDVAGMSVAEGVLTARGGLVSHAALVARGWGIPCVVGADELQIADDHFTVGGRVVREGETIAIDGSTGLVTLGAREVADAEAPAELEVVLGWADEVAAGTLDVRANADTAEDARVAREAGAVGIGLCRTEHMFLAPDRLPVVRAMILAETEADEVEALEQLAAVQREDFVGILEAMDGLPVTVRLLDPPLHEFLPEVEGLVIAEARGELDDEGHRLLKAARHWAEANPMIGTRGVRLAHVRPSLYRVQARALFEAVADRRAAGGHPLVEVMIPLTVSGPELAEARCWVEEAAVEAALGEAPVVGTMIETPRAALVAGTLAPHADFFSIGSNDLTQMTFGFSRDDVEVRFLSDYVGRGLLDHNPFDRLDDLAVGELVDLAVERGRTAVPGLKVGVCGEHAGEPASIRRLLAAGVDYLSCSPARLPVTRLAAARAVLGA